MCGVVMMFLFTEMQLRLIPMVRALNDLVVERPGYVITLTAASF